MNSLITSGSAAIAALTYLGQKVLGKTFDLIGDDISKLYQQGRDKILEKASKKLKKDSENKSTNLRVTRDVFWSGAFTDESICAEYFGGILASSRSADGKDDTGIYYVDLIKSLSTTQLKLHYLIYRSFNLFFSTCREKIMVNPGHEDSLISEPLFFLLSEIFPLVSCDDITRDLHIIHTRGLIGHFLVDNHVLNEKKMIPFMKVIPKPLGIQLYAVAHNRLSEWRNFSITDYGDFDSFTPPKHREQSIQKLLESSGIRND